MSGKNSFLDKLLNKIQSHNSRDKPKNSHLTRTSSSGDVSSRNPRNVSKELSKSNASKELSVSLERLSSNHYEEPDDFHEESQFLPKSFHSSPAIPEQVCPTPVIPCAEPSFPAPGAKDPNASVKKKFLEMCNKIESCPYMKKTEKDFIICKIFSFILNKCCSKPLLLYPNKCGEQFLRMLQQFRQSGLISGMTYSELIQKLNYSSMKENSRLQFNETFSAVPRNPMQNQSIMRQPHFMNTPGYRSGYNWGMPGFSFNQPIMNSANNIAFQLRQDEVRMSVRQEDVDNQVFHREVRHEQPSKSVNSLRDITSKSNYTSSNSAFEPVKSKPTFARPLTPRKSLKRKRTEDSTVVIQKVGVRDRNSVRNRAMPTKISNKSVPNRKTSESENGVASPANVSLTRYGRAVKPVNRFWLN